MLKFNNYPPERVGDVELTKKGRLHLQEKNSRMQYLQDEGMTEEYEHLGSTIHDYGRAIGHTLVAAVGTKTDAVNQLGLSIIFDYELSVAEKSREIIRSYFAIGLARGIESESGEGIQAQLERKLVAN
jgi:hypothetical protein